VTVWVSSVSSILTLQYLEAAAMKPDHYPCSPAELWEHFYVISQVPRPSGSEQALRQVIVALAEQRGCQHRSDAFGNLVVYVPASSGREQAGVVIIQNHLDMVTVKASDKQHDFSVDPLQLEVIDGWLRADRTTLGADNGVGVAAALALLTATDLEHPPLELLFTVEEETGLYGASALDSSLLSGNRMLNLDTEDWGEFFIGCSGAKGWELRCQLAREPQSAATSESGWCVTIDGLSGGHSGIQIHEQSGNAIKLLGQWLVEAQQRVAGLAVTGFLGGTAHNVIPAEASLLFNCTEQGAAALRALNDELVHRWRSYLPAQDQALSLSLEPCPCKDSPLTPVAQQTLQQLLLLFPHGAQSYAREQSEELVELSINLAVVRLDAQGLFVESTLRYFNAAQALALEQQVLAIGGWLQAQVTPTIDYPGWEPRLDGFLLALGQEVYREMFGSDAAVKAIHAGLECGIIKGKLGDTDILSFGPTIRGAHSPTERLQIDTVEPFWNLLTALLRRL
jgi:dipeptidase D